jgi:hypothetical protein
LSTATRRNFLRTTLLGSSACMPMMAAVRRKTAQPSLLDEIERRAVRFFHEQAAPESGLVRDRVRATGVETRPVASIAATGFGLSGMCIAERRGYLPRGEARRRASRTLEYLAGRAAHQCGFYWHFIDVKTGERLWGSEASSIDTSWLICGVLHAKAHFASSALDRMAQEIIDRVDWRWMLNGGSLLSHGWTPEHGFLPYRWDSYSELLAMYLLGLASTTSPIPASSWEAWKRPMHQFGPYRYIGPSLPLFVHQYSHAWFDFRERRDRHADYFENSRVATLAHRLACVEQSSKFPWYGENLWGVTASDSDEGYECRATPDGSLVPCAAGGSMVFLPRQCEAVLHNMLKRWGSRVWGRYGFVDAFQPAQGWYGPDVVGIDLGIMLLMAENARTGSVWEAVSSTAETRRGMAAARFSEIDSARLAAPFEALA